MSTAAGSSTASYAPLGGDSFSWSALKTKITQKNTVKACLGCLVLTFVARMERLNYTVQSHVRGSAMESPHLYSVLEDTASQWHSTTTPQRIVPFKARKAPDDIRYAAFGSSMTWGASLEDRETEAYVKLLSLEYGANYGIRSGGPNYPAACLSSMIGDDPYDVFVIEFYTILKEGGLELATRLRERFPDAIIVLAKFWDPPQFMTADRHSSMKSWALSNGYGAGFIHNAEFRRRFVDEVTNNPDRGWHWDWEKDSAVQIDIARKTGAYIVPMGWDPRLEAMLDVGDKLLGSDSFHIGKVGHADFAHRVRALVERVGVPHRPRTGTSFEMDVCYNWFLTGVIGDNNSHDSGLFKYSPNASIGKMPNTEKYAMTFGGEGEGNDTGSKKAQGGWIEMTNPSDNTMYLFVASMVSSDPQYPETEAERVDLERSEEQDTLNPKKMNPLADWGKAQKMKVHVSNLASFGAVGPHQTAKIQFTPLEDSEWPFRIVQIVLTGKADFGSSYGNMPDSSRIRGISSPSN